MYQPIDEFCRKYETGYMLVIDRAGFNEINNTFEYMQDNIDCDWSMQVGPSIDPIYKYKEQDFMDDLHYYGEFGLAWRLLQQKEIAVSICYIYGNLSGIAWVPSTFKQTVVADSPLKDKLAFMGKVDVPRMLHIIKDDWVTFYGK